MGHWAKTLLALSRTPISIPEGCITSDVFCLEIKDTWSLCQHWETAFKSYVHHAWLFLSLESCHFSRNSNISLLSSVKVLLYHLRKASHAGGEYYSNEAYLLCFSFCKNHSPVFPVVYDLQASASDMLPSIIVVCFLKPNLVSVSCLKAEDLCIFFYLKCSIYILAGTIAFVSCSVKLIFGHYQNSPYK